MCVTDDDMEYVPVRAQKGTYEEVSMSGKKMIEAMSIGTDGDSMVTFCGIANGVFSCYCGKCQFQSNWIEHKKP